MKFCAVCSVSVSAVKRAVCSTLIWMVVQDTEDLSEPQRKLIGELKMAIEMGKARERTAATMTLLKLCESMARLQNYDLSLPSDSPYHTHTVSP